MRYLSLLISTLPLWASCDPGIQEPAIEDTTSFLTPVGSGPESDLVDKAGRRYKWQRKATFSPATADNPVVEGPPRDDVEETRTPDELADGLRAIVIQNGQVYKQELPDREAAEKILSGFKAPRTKGFRGSAPEPPAQSAEGIEARRGAYVLGVDTRVWLNQSRTSYPYRLTARHKDTGCSSTLIGPQQAVVAAHCVMDCNGYPKRTTPNNFAPAWDTAATAPAAPYGPFTINAVWVPAGFANGGSCDSYHYDYAMFQFTTSSPGNIVGYMGTWDTDTGGGQGMQMVGYPQDKGNNQAWWKSGPSTTSNLYRRRHQLDVVGGDSGAGLYTYDPGDQGYWLTGIHSTENREWWFGWSYWNEAQKWTAELYVFFQSHGWPGNPSD